MQRRKKTVSLYILIAALAVLSVVGLLIAFSSSREAERQLQEKRDTEQRIQEDKQTQALALLTSIKEYAAYCQPLIMRIDRSGDILRIVKSSGTNNIQYERSAKRFTCTDDSKTEICDTAKAAHFTSVYSCPQTPRSAAVAEKNGLMLASQQEGTAVIIDQVVLTHPGFIVISQSKDEKQLAHSNLVPSGVHDIVSIAIPNPLTKGEYRATLYVDSGNGIFDDADSPIMSEDGKLLSVIFTAKKR